MTFFSNETIGQLKQLTIIFWSRIRVDLKKTLNQAQEENKNR